MKATSRRRRFVLLGTVLAASLGAAALALRDDGQHLRGADRPHKPKPTTIGGAATPTVPVTCTSASTRLSFISTRNGQEEIYVLDIRRPARVTRVTRLAGIVQDQTWSPDGRRLAFRWFQPRDQTVGVYIANADGSNVKLLVDHGVTPAWSPDGRLIAYAMPGASISVIQVEEALKGDRSAARLVVRPHDELGQAEYPVWSPDGRRLLFSGLRGGSFDIWAVDADGTHLRDVTPQPSLEYGATWSPDGTHIVFGSDRESSSQFGGDIFAMNADGTQLHRLTANQGGNYAPAWSPDGQWIAFNSNRDGNTEIYIMRPDGSDQQRLTEQSQEDVAAVWVGGCHQ
jgi:TolB protein